MVADGLEVDVLVAGTGAGGLSAALYAAKAAGRDRVVVAACSREEQVRRAMARDGLSAADIERRLAAQLPIDVKRARADDVIDTGGSLAETERQVRAVWEKLLG